MKVLHVITRFEAGGAERNLAYYMRFQQGLGYEVTLAAGRVGCPELLEGANVLVVPELRRRPNPVMDARAFAALRRLIRDGAYDIVHTHESKAGVLGRLAARGRVRTIFHTVHMASFGPAYAAPLSFLFRRLERHCATFTDRMIYVGSELRDLYLDAGVGDAARSRVIRSPIDLERFLAVRDMDRAARRALRGSLLPPGTDGGRVVVMVGVLEPRKRHVLALRSLAPLIGRDGLQLVIAGEGPERARIEAEASRLGVSEGLHLMGHVQAPEQLMAVSDVFLHTSRVEGVAQSVVQALAAGLPVVATEVTGLREAGPSGLLIADAAERSIAAAVEEALQQPHRMTPEENFAPWSHVAVEEAIVALHAELETAAVSGLMVAGSTASR
jgi:glycosyltransferase involved in cell wall biosynthesis